MTGKDYFDIMYYGLALVFFGNELEKLEAFAAEKGYSLYEFEQFWENTFYFKKNSSENLLLLSFKDLNGRKYRPESMLVIETNKQSTPFNHAYSSKEELIADVRNTILQSPVFEGFIDDCFDCKLHIGEYAAVRT